MSESDTYKIIEIAGTSPDGVSEAMRSGVARAAQTLRGLDWVEVRSIRGHVEDEFKRLPMGITLNIEETPKVKPGAVLLSYEGFHNSLRAVFGR